MRWPFQTSPPGSYWPIPPRYHRAKLGCAHLTHPLRASLVRMHLISRSTLKLPGDTVWRPLRMKAGVWKRCRWHPGGGVLVLKDVLKLEQWQCHWIKFMVFQGDLCGEESSRLSRDFGCVTCPLCCPGSSLEMSMTIQHPALWSGWEHPTSDEWKALCVLWSSMETLIFTFVVRVTGTPALIAVARGFC